MAVPIGLITMAKAALTAIVGPFVEEARDAALNAAQDTIRGVIVGRMSIEEWAKIVIKGVDGVKDRIVSESELRYIGGNLKIMMSANAADNVSVSFELYFQDELNKWHKAAADSDIPMSMFTLEALEELRSKKEISYEVE